MSRSRRPLVAVAALALIALPASADDPETRRWLAWHERRALELTAENRVRESVEEWLALTNLDPANPTAAVRAGIAAIDAGSAPGRVIQKQDPFFMLADMLNTEAVRRGGIHDPARAYMLGRMRMVERSWDKAFVMLDLARRRGYDPVKADYWWFSAVVNHTVGLVDAGALDESVALLKRALQDVPNHPDRLAALINLATSYRRRNESTLAEAVLTQDVFPKWPRAAKAHDVLGQIYADQNRLDSAIEQYRKAMDIAQEWDDGVYSGPAIYQDALLHFGTIELRAMRLEHAEELAQQYLELRKDDVEGMYLLGSAQFARGRDQEKQELMKEALRTLRRGARLAENHEPIRSKLLEVLHHLGLEEDIKSVEAELKELMRKGDEEERLKKAKQPR